jgi:hypothetical protein
MLLECSEDECFSAKTATWVTRAGGFCLDFGTLKLYKIMYNKPHKLFLKREKLVLERFKMRL